jgi:hypothetical protein
MSEQDIHIGAVNLDSGNKQEFKRLEFPFVKNGFTHELIKRDGLVCLVKRTRVGYPELVPHYEVVKLRHADSFTDRLGNFIPACEVYPKTEDWGKYGFTYRTLDAIEWDHSALSRYDSMAQGSAKQRVSRAASVKTQPILKPSCGTQIQQLELEAA